MNISVVVWTPTQNLAKVTTKVEREMERDDDEEGDRRWQYKDKDNNDEDGEAHGDDRLVMMKLQLWSAISGVYLDYNKSTMKRI